MCCVNVCLCVQVGSLKDMYHFELPGNAGEHSPHKTEALKAEEMVHYFVCYPFSFSLCLSLSCCSTDKLKVYSHSL